MLSFILVLAIGVVSADNSFGDHVSDLNYKNWKDELMAKPSETNYFILWHDD